MIKQVWSGATPSGEKNLRVRNKPVKLRTEVQQRAAQKLARDLVHTMWAHKAYGLAAPQIGVYQRAFVIDQGENKQGHPNMPLICFNPTLEFHDAKKEKMKEGCLSYPGMFVEIERYTSCEINCQLLDGSDAVFEVEGVLAQAAQHEIDHLDSRLIIDYQKESQNIISLDNQELKSAHESPIQSI